MEYQIQKDGQNFSIFYAETFSRFLKEIYSQWEDSSAGILVIANQLYYAQYAESFTEWEQHFPRFSWYICPNNRYCHSFSELENCLDFLSVENLHETTYLLLLGNDGVFQLGGFLSQNIPQIRQTVMITPSLQVIESTLNAQAEILYHSQPLLCCEFSLPKLFYDSNTKFSDKMHEKSAEFLLLLQVALSYDYSLLQELYRAFPDYEALEKQGFVPFISPYLSLLETNHLLEKQKRERFLAIFNQVTAPYMFAHHDQLAIGLCLYLMISQKKSGFSFHLKNFLIWLLRLGYQIHLPKQILSADLAESICHTLKQNPDFLFLSKIGKSDKRITFACSEIIEIIDDFRMVTAELAQP